MIAAAQQAEARHLRTREGSPVVKIRQQSAIYEMTRENGGVETGNAYARRYAGLMLGKVAFRRIGRGIMQAQGGARRWGRQTHDSVRTTSAAQK